MWAKLLKLIIKYGSKAVKWVRKNWKRLIDAGWTIYEIAELVKALFG